MADQRRRGGRGRSGRGGRIPRKGEGGGSATYQGETFVSFPLDVTGPIRVPSALDDGAVEKMIAAALERERAQAAALAALAAAGDDAALAELGAQSERHREALQQLARELGAELTADPSGEPAVADAAGALSAQHQARFGWLLLQRAAYASGDKRIDRVAKGVLREKERQTDVLEELTLRRSIQGLYRDPE